MRVLWCVIVFICIATKSVFGSTGFEPVINGVIDDVVNKNVSESTVTKTSNTLLRSADIYHSAKVSANTIKKDVLKKPETAAPKKQKQTFWQTIDKLILGMRNSNSVE